MTLPSDRMLRVKIKQQGSALLFSLIMLLILTVAGLTSMQGSTLQQQMISGQEDSHITFQAAETALRRAELFIQETAFNTLDFQECSSGSNCFKDDCSGGLCRTVDYAVGDSGANCKPKAVSIWKNENIWKNSDSSVVMAKEGQPVDIRQLIEFRCYIKKVANTSLPFNLSEWSEYYRVTVLATGLSGQSQIMLQSTVKKN